MQLSYSINQLPYVVKQLIDVITSKTLLFYGDMGVGKTTLIKELVKQLGSEDVASSPTFSLVNEYRSQQGERIFHFDFYRIDHEEEALDIGIEEYLYNDHWCFIEWPEKIKNLLPLDAVAIYLTKNDDESRTIAIK